MSNIRGKLTIFRKGGQLQTVHDLPVEQYREAQVQFNLGEIIQLSYTDTNGTRRFVGTDQATGLEWEQYI